MKKVIKNKPLTDAQKALNRKKSKIRCRVEHNSAISPIPCAELICVRLALIEQNLILD
jgi:hypothetical protein